MEAIGFSERLVGRKWWGRESDENSGTCFSKWSLSVWGSLEIVWGLREMEIGGLRYVVGGGSGGMIGFEEGLGIFSLGEGWDGWWMMGLGGC